MSIHGFGSTMMWFIGHDGPAVIFPDGVERWYIRGKEITRDVKTYFFQNKWRVESGLDTPEKRILFSSHFVK